MRSLRHLLLLGHLALLAFGLTRVSPALADIKPVVEFEEVVATCPSPNNGSGPYWCYGAPLLVRQGDQVFASVMEVGEGVPPLCNTRWRLFRRDDKAWTEVLHEPDFRQREPCPLAAPTSDHLLLSANPSIRPAGTEYGPCQPQALLIDSQNPSASPRALPLEWPDQPNFTDHSYRGLAADRHTGDVLLLNIDARTSAQHWALGDTSNGFTRFGAIHFPLRSCYPQVALRLKAAHVLAISDIVEPNPAWRDHKKQATGASWDYVFRRLFYTHCQDLARGDFQTPIEVDSVDDTAGHITNLDLWLDAEGSAHVLYLKANTTSTVRARFFPDLPILTTLEYVVIKDGQITRRATLPTGSADNPGNPRYGRFHATADGTLHAITSEMVKNQTGTTTRQNRLLRLTPEPASTSTLLDLAEPFSSFFTATERGGSQPSDTLDLLGSSDDSTVIRYARIRLK